MRATPVVLALILALVGLVWIGQGVGLVGGSFMTGSAWWGVIGLGLLVVAAAIIVRERRRRGRRG